MKIYVVTMYRWGDNENHSYVVGAFVDDPDKAIRLGKEMMEYRGRKYEPEVVCFDDVTDPPKVTTILKLGDVSPRPILRSCGSLGKDGGIKDGGKQDSV